MGFFGISCTGDSDLAADLAYVANNALAKELAKGLKKESGEWNTPGPINVALYFEEFVKSVHNSDELAAVLDDTIATLEAIEWPEEAKRLKQLIAKLRTIPR